MKACLYQVNITILYCVRLQDLLSMQLTFTRYVSSTVQQQLSQGNWFQLHHSLLVPEVCATKVNLIVEKLKLHRYL